MSSKFIAWFNEIEKEDIGTVGGKGANLGEMFSAGFPIPFGFVITSNAYFHFLQINELPKKIAYILSYTDFENQEHLTDSSEQIRKLIETGHIPRDLTKTIAQGYDEILLREQKFRGHSGTAHDLAHHLSKTVSAPFVAVRSSATAEDLPGASFAGQQETYLNVRGENHLLHKVRDAWGSLFTPRAMYYRNTKGFEHMKIGLAAVVQRMVQSDVSGIAFSIDPVTNNKSTITIEAIFGLGEYIVGGNLTPDHYEVDKKTHTIVKKEIKEQLVQFIKQDGNTQEIKVDKSHQEEQKLPDQKIIELSKIVANIEKHYFFPQDIEWAMDKDQLFIVQSRPITTMGSKQSKIGVPEASKLPLLVKGDPASPGMRSGKPVILSSPKELGKIVPGDILVASQTNPDYVPAMRKATAIVTERGGRTSHAAIVSRELGIPAVVGAADAIKILKHQSVVTVNGSTGEVFKGAVAASEKPMETSKLPKHSHLKTLTHVYVNLAEPEEAERIAKLDVDGVGLLRAEFMVAAIGTHPKKFIAQGKEHEFITMLSEKMVIFAKAFAPRPVIYRATDFKTNEYKNLKGGEEYEPEEENPMIGFRGASRYIVDQKVFEMELKALKKVRARGYKNMHLMIPFIRTPNELRSIRGILKQSEMLDLPSFKLWIMIEVPSAVLMLEEFLKIGVDGLSVGTNDLTMLIMGVDRDNAEIAHLYDEQSPAVLWALERIATLANKYNVTVSVCGQAPSDYPDLVEKLVNWHFTSVSVNPDAVARTREIIFDVERQRAHKKND